MPVLWLRVSHALLTTGWCTAKLSVLYMVCAVMLLAALAWARVHPCRWVVVGLCMLLGSLGLCPGRWRGLCLASTRCVKSRGSSSDCLVMVACAWLMATAMLVKSRLRLSGCLWLLP